MSRTLVRLSPIALAVLAVASCSNSPDGKVLTCWTPGEEDSLYKIEIVSETRWYYSGRSGAWTTNQGKRSYTPPENTVCSTEEES